jgi:hypothetical protein
MSRIATFNPNRAGQSKAVVKLATKQSAGRTTGTRTLQGFVGQFCLTGWFASQY